MRDHLLKHFGKRKFTNVLNLAKQRLEASEAGLTFQVVVRILFMKLEAEHEVELSGLDLSWLTPAVPRVVSALKQLVKFVEEKCSDLKGSKRYRQRARHDAQNVSTTICASSQHEFPCHLYDLLQALRIISHLDHPELGILLKDSGAWDTFKGILQGRTFSSDRPVVEPEARNHVLKIQEVQSLEDSTFEDQIIAQYGPNEPTDSAAATPSSTT